MRSNDEIMDTRLAAVRQLATLPDGAFNHFGLAWAAAYRQDVTALRARLTTAETERDELRRGCAMQDELRQVAEARVEAAEQFIDKAVWHLENSRRQDALSVLHDAQAARAALACPPQQRGEK